MISCKLIFQICRTFFPLKQSKFSAAASLNKCVSTYSFLNSILISLFTFFSIYIFYFNDTRELCLVLIKLCGIPLECKVPSPAFSADSQPIDCNKSRDLSFAFTGLRDHTSEVKVTCPSSYSIIF